MKTHPSQPSAPGSVAAEVTRLELSNKQRLLTSSATKLPSATHSQRQSPNRGFTRTDLGVLLAAVGLLAVLATSVLGKISPAAHRAGCANNLRQMGVGIFKFATEHNNIVPWFTIPIQGGSAGKQFVYQHFATLSNYVDTPRIMVCPSDAIKRPAIDFTTNASGLHGMGNQAAGYAIMTEVFLVSPKALVLGDRLIDEQNISASTCRGGYDNDPVLRTFPALPVKTFSNSRVFYWANSLHDSAIGNLLFADGAVQAVDSQGLRTSLHSNPTDANRSGCTMMP